MLQLVTAAKAKGEPWGVDRQEKRKTHEMIPVRMSQQQVNLAGVFFPHQFLTQRTQACPGIDYQKVTVPALNGNAGRVPAIF